MRGGSERRTDLVGVAVMIIERDVAGDVVVKLRRARFCRLSGIGHGRQRLDVEFDGFRRVSGLRHSFRDHERDGIADEADLVGRKRRAVGLQQRQAVAALQRQTAGEGVVAGGRQIGAGPDPEHAGQGLGRRGIDALDDAMGMGGAHNPGIGLSGEGEIVGVFALAAHQRVVLLAADGLSHTMFLQCDSVFQRGGRRVILHGKYLKRADLR